MNRRSVNDDLDEVDSLLREAQDEVLLNLTVNSHISRGASHIDPDLNARFQALKLKPSRSQPPSSSAKPQSTPAKVKPKDGVADVGDDDLFARFTALKSSIQSSSSDSNPKDEKLTRFESGEGEDEEDEVEKLIQWAVDAARLDPSSPSDEEDDDSDDDSDDDRKKKKK